MPRSNATANLTQTQTATKQQTGTHEATQPQAQPQAQAKKLFKPNPLLSGHKHNVRRQVRLPYALVVNKDDAGIHIPKEQLSKAFWYEMPEQFQKVVITTEPVEGYFLQQARILFLAKGRDYVRYKDDPDKVEPEKLNQYVGYYDELELQGIKFDKKVMDCINEFLVYFVDELNKLLHKIPFKIRFKNVALYSLLEALDSHYLMAETAYAEFADEGDEEVRFSSKSDAWRACVVFNVKFFSEYEGEGKNQSPCMKASEFQHCDSVEALEQLILDDEYTIKLAQGAATSFLLPPPVKMLPEAQGQELVNGNTNQAHDDEMPF
jgi:hypothetical protein